VIQPTLARKGMRYWRLEPDARLRPWILCYWMVEPDGAAPAEADQLQLLIPDGHSEIVFRLAGSFTRWSIDAPTRRARMAASYVIGGRSKSVLTQSAGGLRLTGVKLDPRALRALIGTPLSELRDTTVACADLGSTFVELEEKAANLGSVEQLAGTFDQFFLRRMTDSVAEGDAVARLLARIRATRGSQSILQWAREHRVDPRTLERRFVAQMGMTPKRFARIERFKHSYHRLGTKPGRSRAYLENYYDESHFHRDFRHFLGMSPLTWLDQRAQSRTTIADHLLDGELSFS
jgi:methylphosphotriester-DNA--protein-cysteine methyltransferase